MKPTHSRGFTLVEVLISIGVTGVVAAAVFLLLDSGISAHDRGAEMSSDLGGVSEAATLLRADLARSATIDHAGPDSLQLTLPSGTGIRWVVRDGGDERWLYRSVDEGGGWSESPMRPVAVLESDHGLSAGIDFVDLPDGRLEAIVHSHGDRYRITGARWSQP